MTILKYIIPICIASLTFINCAINNQSGNIAAKSKTSNGAAQNYMEYCASCHGTDARAFADRRNWVHGSDKTSLIGVIAKGLEDEGMPSFEATFSPEETASLADYIIEAKEQVETFAFDNEFDENETFSYDGHDYKLELVTDEVDIPWGIAQSSNGDLYYTDIAGELRRRNNKGEVQSISGLPKMHIQGQGGLLDVSLDPNFDKNQHIYLSYSKPNPEVDTAGTTAVYKGRLDGNKIVDGKDIWIGLPYLPTKYHFGSRIIWDNDGYLFISIGDRGKRDENPQNLSVAPGKIHRINNDGSIPKDNPFVDVIDAVKSIFSYGHRNPQGLAYDKKNNIIYENEHGPRGGDEINIIKPKKNFGWPEISYGINYNGTVFTEKTEESGMEQPIHYWVPAIGVCGLAYVDSPLYPDWQGKLLSGSLKYKYLNLSDTKANGTTIETKLFPQIGRLRSVIQGTDGYIYIGVEKPGRIYKVLPQ